MADQKTEDTKSPLPRRGVRPFAGPAGTSAARPFLRPVTTPQRLTAAPFVPPVVPGNPALGSPVPAPEAPTAAGIPVVPVATSTVASSSGPRPVTSEMIAVDAFDAFDTVWGADEHPAAATEPHPPASPLDESSLGGGIGAQGLYTPPTSAIPAWLEDDALVTPAPADEQALTPEPAPELELPRVLAPAPAWPTSEYDPSYAITEWTPAHGVPAADNNDQPVPSEPLAAAPIESSLGAEVQTAAATSDMPSTASAEPPRFELVPEPQAVDSEPVETTGATRTPHTRVAASLDRLADRIRSGEIDVSSIAPDAPDAAVLASVLAALLGGSSSR